MPLFLELGMWAMLRMDRARRSALIGAIPERRHEPVPGRAERPAALPADAPPPA